MRLIGAAPKIRSSPHSVTGITASTRCELVIRPPSRVVIAGGQRRRRVAALLPPGSALHLRKRFRWISRAASTAIEPKSCAVMSNDYQSVDKSVVASSDAGFAL